MCARKYRRLYNIASRSFRIRIGDIIRHGSHKDISILRYHRHISAQIVKGQFPYINAVNENRSLIDIVQTGDKIDKRRLSGAGTADNSQHFTRLDMHTDVF